MGTTKKLSRGKKPDYTISPVMNMLSDTFGGEWQTQQTNILVCMGPSAHDKQDSLNSMCFAADTGKARSMIGPMNELEGLRGEHVLLLDPAGKIAVTRSITVLA